MMEKLSGKRMGLKRPQRRRRGMGVRSPIKGGGQEKEITHF